MRPALALALLVALVGCGSGDGAGVALDPNVKPRKPFEQMTRAEKIDQINRSPMPDKAKQDEIAKLGAG